jgi:hypothetical protein
MLSLVCYVLYLLLHASLFLPVLVYRQPRAHGGSARLMNVKRSARLWSKQQRSRTPPIRRLLVTHSESCRGQASSCRTASEGASRAVPPNSTAGLCPKVCCSSSCRRPRHSAAQTPPTTKITTAGYSWTALCRDRAPAAAPAAPAAAAPRAPIAAPSPKRPSPALRMPPREPWLPGCCRSRLSALRVGRMKFGPS